MRRSLVGAVLIVMGCGGNDPASPVLPAAATVTILDAGFSAPSVSVQVGEAVRWNNNGSQAHTVTADGGSFGSGQLGAPGTDAYGSPTAGATYRVEFNTAGTFPYHCNNHPTMTGTVTVTP